MGELRETYNRMVDRVTTEYILSRMEDDATHDIIESELVYLTQTEVIAHNQMIEETGGMGKNWELDNHLTHYQIARLLTHRENIIRLNYAGEGGDTDMAPIAVYINSGPDEGVYTTSMDEITKTVRNYHASIKTREIDEVIAMLRNMAPVKTRSRDADLVAVANGIFNFKTKELTSFDPEYVFISKSGVNYKENPTNPIIEMHDGEMWDVVSWFNGLSDDQEIVQSLWEVMGACIRPNVNWGKTAWLYSEMGNNGKGTVATLMRNLVGTGNYASIPLADFGKEFRLGPLTKVNAIIVDENDVGTYIDKAADLKAIITNDIITISQKFKDPISYRFHGMMVQCMNEFPKVKDRSESFYRRQLFIPMNKRFEGVERKYIKNDYLYREDVLEYVLNYLLHMDYYELSTPAVCAELLEEYKEFNDPVRQFLDDILPQLKWSLIPMEFLHDLYVAWLARVNKGSTAVSRKVFSREVKLLMASENNYMFEHPAGSIGVSKTNMSESEPLIYEYKLEHWKNEDYDFNAGSTNKKELCRPRPEQLKKQYRGLRRKDGLGAIEIKENNTDSVDE